MTVYVVQETLSGHCPECDSHRVRRTVKSMRCIDCRKDFEKPVFRPRHDFSPAAEFGELEVLHDHFAKAESMGERDNRVGTGLQPFVARMRSKLSKFSDDDYLLPVGDPVLICTAAALAAEANMGRVKYLRWDRRSMRYVEVSVRLKT